MSIGERIRAVREAKRLSQQNLADAAKITQASLSRIEKGHVQQIKSTTLRQLAKALKVGLDELMGSPSANSLMIEYQDPALDHLVRTYHRLSLTGRRQLVAISQAILSLELDEGVYRMYGLEGNTNPITAVLGVAEAVENQQREIYESSPEYASYAVEQCEAVEMFHAVQAREAEEREALNEHIGQISYPEPDSTITIDDLENCNQPGAER